MTNLKRDRVVDIDDVIVKVTETAYNEQAFALKEYEI